MANCDNALNAYNLLILDGVDIESKVQKDCTKRRELILVFRLLFLAWVAVAGQALLCLILHFGLPWICDALFLLALAGAGLLILLFLEILRLTIRLASNKKKCDDINKRLKDAYDVVKRDCPQERWPAELAKMKCDCD